MQAVVLEKKGEIAIRDIDIDEQMGPDDVRIAIHTVGICGSDVHYYECGGVGPFVVRQPMVLGHEASGTVLEVGAGVEKLKPGDRVCMEPGIPNLSSRATLEGHYNLDPDVEFWATPPGHGCLRASVVHPAWLTFKLPENVSYAVGALVEPLSVGMHGVTKGQVKPGDVAVVLGAGTIGLMTTAVALAAGCSRVILVDRIGPKLAVGAALGAVTPVNFEQTDVAEAVLDATGGWGADIVFEASGNPAACASTLDLVCPGGKVVIIGCPVEPVTMEIVKAQAKEVTIVTIFRYANVYPRALALLASGKVNVEPFITDVYEFERSVEAFEYALNPRPETVKVQIVMPGAK
jgi:D-xylulose reductase